MRVLRAARHPALPDGLDPHVAVVRAERSVLDAVLGVDERTTVVLGADPSGTYGHAVGLVALDEAAGQLIEVRREPAGAWLTHGSRDRVFVPAEAFLGGR